MRFSFSRASSNTHVFIWRAKNVFFETCRVIYVLKFAVDRRITRVKHMMPTLFIMHVYDALSKIHDGSHFNGQLRIPYLCFCLFWSFNRKSYSCFFNERKWAISSLPASTRLASAASLVARKRKKGKKTTSCWRLLSYRGHAAISVWDCEPGCRWAYGPAVMPRHVLVPVSASKRYLLSTFSRGIASAADYYFGFFICVAVCSAPVSLFFFVFCFLFFFFVFFFFFSTLFYVAQLVKCYRFFPAGSKPTNSLSSALFTCSFCSIVPSSTMIGCQGPHLPVSLHP